MVSNGAKPAEATTRNRLDAAGERFQDRLEQLLESGTLSREEAAAIAEAGAEFEALVERMDNALAEGGLQQDGKLQRAFNYALNSLRNDVSSALSGGSDPDPTKAAAATTTKVFEARATGESKADPDATAERLASAFDRVEERLASLMEQRGVQGQSAMQGLEERFGAVFDRLESAVAGGMNTEALGDLFQRMMDGLRDGVRNSNVGAGNDEPVLYDSKSSISSLGASQASGGVNTVG